MSKEPTILKGVPAVLTPHAKEYQILTGKELTPPENIEKRMEEICIMAREKISSASYFSPVFGGVVLTGGSALLPQIDELAEKIFELPVEVRFPKDLKGLSGVLESPIYSTAVGLVQYGIE